MPCHGMDHSAICKVSRQKIEKVYNGWQWASNDKRLRNDRHTSTSAGYFLVQRQSDCEPATK